MNKILKKIWMTFAILIILMAVLSSIFRSLTPWAKQYKSNVEQHLSVLLGQPVTIKTMETGWYWFQPVLKLNQVTLGDDSQKAFHLNKLLVGINLFRSVWSWQVQPGILYVDDMHLILRQQKGHWTINGISTDTLSSNEMTPEKTQQILMWLSQQERVIIKHISAYFYFSDGGLVPVDGLNMSVLNHGGHYKLKGNARLGQTNSTYFQLLGDGYFDPNHFENIEGKFYFSAQNIVPAQWQSLFPKAAQHVEGGKGDIQLWMDIHQGAVSSIQAQVSLERLAWRLLNKERSQLIQSFFANLSWKPDDMGWQLHGDSIQLRIGGVSWPENQLLIKHNKEQQSYQFFVKNIIIESLLSDAINWSHSIQVLLQMKPQGVLHDTQILVKAIDNSFRIAPIPKFVSANTVQDNVPSTNTIVQQDSLDDWTQHYEVIYVLTRFEQLGWSGNTKKNIPEVRNLSGAISWQPEEGRLELDSENTKIAVTGYPEQNLTLLNGAFDWKELSDGLRISIERFVLGKTDLTLSAQGAIDQVTRNSLGYVRLGAEFSGKNIEQWAPFLPQKHMKAKLYTWLTRDLKHIAEMSGKVTLNGMMQDFPFDNNQGEFTILSHISGGELYINPKWRIIKEIEGTLQLKNRNLNIDLVHADFQGIPAKQVHLRIDDIGKDRETLIIHGGIYAPVQKMVNYVMASPLNSRLALLKQLTVKGFAQLNLNMQVPLYPENDKVLAKGDLTFSKNTIVVKRDLLQFTLNEVTGDVFFNEEGVSDSTLVAMLQGRPLTIKIQSEKALKPATSITAEGNWVWDHQYSPLLQGSFPVKVVLRLAHTPSEANTINLTSSLYGLAVKAKLLPNKDWSFSVNQKNIAADLLYRAAANEFSGHVHRLHFDEIDFSHFGSSGKSVKLHPKQIPNLNLRIDNLSIGKIRLGDLVLKSQSTPERWLLNYCRISSPVYQFDINGAWTQKNAVNKTTVHVKLNINNLAKTFERWGINPSVDAKKGYVEFKGGWNNDLVGFSLALLNGEMYLQLKDGRITDLSQETEGKLDLGKLLSILSLQTIPRRLQLDFSDLAHQGYSFDIFQGSFRINKGRMNTQDSYIDGPVAYASMKGDLDLVRRTYDLTLKVSPHITASLPVVATIAGGPVAGVATWVATKIINQGMQTISAYSYKISGPWKQPVVQQLSIIKKKNSVAPKEHGAIKVQPNLD